VGGHDPAKSWSGPDGVYVDTNRGLSKLTGFGVRDLNVVRCGDMNGLLTVGM
jgi:hypothetical protein